MAVNVSGVPLLGTPGNFEELEHAFAALQTWLGTLNSNFGLLSSSVSTVTNQVATATARAVISVLLKDVPTTLGAADAGALYLVTDYAHLIRWSGTAWQFMDGGNQYFRDFAVAPGANTGWALADGSTVTFMTVGAVTGTDTRVLPNLNGTVAYKKTAATYSGSIVAGAGSSGGSGALTVSGTSGAESAHTHAITSPTGGPSANGSVQGTNGAGTTVPIFGNGSTGYDGHTHSITTPTGAGSSHSHGAGTFVAADHTHGIGSLDPAHLNVLPYFRL